MQQKNEEISLQAIKAILEADQSVQRQLPVLHMQAMLSNHVAVLGLCLSSILKQVDDKPAASSGTFFL